MPGGSDPLGRRALFWAPGVRTDDHKKETPERSGRRALFSAPEESRSGTLVLRCSSCGTDTRVTYADFLRRHLPFWLWIPGRRYSRLLSCPACGRRTWLEADFRG